MKSSLPFIKNMYKWQDKKEKIEALEKEILLIKQQVVFENAIGNKKAKGDER